MKHFSLIEKWFFHGSKQCLNYLLEENASLKTHTIKMNMIKLD